MLKLKKLASDIAISFFFASIFVLVFYFLVEDKISPYISLINTTAVKENNVDKKTEYNFESKKLLKYPNYGQKYATLNISAINLSLPIYFGDTTKILKSGVGHYAGSYFPGENGSIILAAHNNKGFFHDIPNLKNGDKIIIDADYGKFYYEVDEYKVVKETDLSAFPIKHDEELLIMYTCYPIDKSVVGRKKERYVVYAKRIGDINAES